MATEVYLFLPPPAASGHLREAHAFGPSAAGFRTDIGIEIEPAQVDQFPILAVISGQVRVIPDPGAGPTVTLVQVPAPTAVTDLGAVTGGSVVVFVYRNIQAAEVRSRFASRVAAIDDELFGTSATLSDRMDDFMAGAFGVWARAGDELGLAEPNGVGGWGLTGFEVVFSPNALVGDAGWSRLQEIVDPATERTRRMDPIAFFEAVSGAGGGLTLAPGHGGHWLLTTPTRRNLLEIRDEFDMPFAGTVTVTDSTAGTGPVVIPAADRGFAVLATTPAAGAPPTATYDVALANHVFTELPSGSQDSANPSATLTAPQHWALQRIFMADVTDPANWFVPNTPALPRFTSNNRITPLIDGLPTFREMVAEMGTVTAPEHYFRLAGWWLTDDFEMVPLSTGTSFAHLTQAMDTAGAQVRVMLWDQWGRQNTAEVNHVNALPGGNGRAILDNDIFLVGSHHQKFMIINGSGGALAFCGGIDINPDRLDDHRHRAPSPYHDTHAKVEGPAVADLNTSFVERWNNHPSGPPALPVAAPPFAANPGHHYVQVTRTYPPRRAYPFAPAGDLGTLNAVRNAIRKAERYIYLEEQYATPYPGDYPFVAAQDTVGILTDLLATLAKPSFEYLIIVIPNHTTVPQDKFRRHHFIRPMRDAFPDKVFVFYLERPARPGPAGSASTTAIVAHDLETIASSGSAPAISGSEDPDGVEALGSSPSGGNRYPNEIYVHSKVWIVDDVFVKIGSANCNRRSMTHDTEIDINVVDGALLNGARALARRFRVEMWAEHLNMRGPRRRLLDDPTYALHFWRHPPTGAYIRPYDENAEHALINTDLFWNGTHDPDGR